MSKLQAVNLFNIQGWVASPNSGGGTGVGRMMATCLAQNGARVYITGRRLEKLQETAQGFSNIFPIVADSTKKEDIERIVAEIGKKEDHVDVLINNSGVTTVHAQLDAEDNSPEAVSKRMFEQSFDDWKDPYAINVAAMYFTTAAFIPLLVNAQKYRDESGNVINVTSVSGIIKNSQDGQFSYNSNKAAAVSLTNQLALELARPHLGIRVNQLALGYFPSQDTQMTSIETEGEKDHFRKNWNVPFGRAGRADDISKVVLNLATNGYQSGSTQVVDGAYILASDHLHLDKYV
ncbi:NAD(P)-binding protein [Wallemia mellicola]|nr:NAD(P)-binding protein [Wallemia mellicola]